MDYRSLARAQGAFNLLGGAWPLVHLRSFEAVCGPKTDRWLVRTVAGLLVTNGVVQLLTGPSDKALEQARRVGVGTAATLGVIDAVYGGSGRISRVYLLDALVEFGWIGAWVVAGPVGGKKSKRKEDKP